MGTEDPGPLGSCTARQTACPTSSTEMVSIRSYVAMILAPAIQDVVIVNGDCPRC